MDTDHNNHLLHPSDTCDNNSTNLSTSQSPMNEVMNDKHGKGRGRTSNHDNHQITTLEEEEGDDEDLMMSLMGFKGFKKSRW